ncbi:MAG: V-type ATP synthase subunit A [Firmicutes bacterium]|nr:V-type ATP synthase subunit A [Bacillota bacterium]
MGDVNMYDVVNVSKMRLVGEIIELREDRASIQVYEETSGLTIGEEVISTGMPLSVELAPGIMGGIYDGIARPLDKILEQSGDRIARGIQVSPIDRKKKWDFVPKKKVGDKVVTGDIIGTVQENEVVEHRIMVPHGVSGKIKKITSGKFTITETIAEITNDKGKTVEVQMLQKWPVRKGRPYKSKLSPSQPLITGQRVMDTLFPIAKGGVAAIPGPFGSGKTVVQHQIAKWSDAEIVVYIGCGERGNEMTDVLNEFPHLMDMRNGQPIMKRTILIANTSDMPVAAREASMYTGITIAEYFRDQGYNVAIMADSTSRWAEALREMSGRLEELPGEEGYPAYLSSRLAEFYERAGMVKILGTEDRLGSITAIGAVSPPGGDLSEPVSQGTLRIVKVFWGLSSALAYKRHFPAIDWLISYSLYSNKLEKWYDEEISPAFHANRIIAMKLLQEDSSLEEIVRLVGVDSLSDRDKLIMDTSKSIKEDFLHQNAFNDQDAYSTLKKQFKILNAILEYHRLANIALESGVEYGCLVKPELRSKISRFRYLPEDEIGKIDEFTSTLKSELSPEKSMDEDMDDVQLNLTDMSNLKADHWDKK